MKWAEISLRTSHEATELVADIFHDLGASGVVIEDPELLNSYIESGQWDYTDLKPADNTEVVTVKAYLPSDEALDKKLKELEDRLDFLSKSGVRSDPGEFSWNEVQDEDWSESWKKYFHTEKVGRRVVIKPTWEEYEALPDDVVIEIDPGAAFGTGNHPTTAMCIRELELLVKRDMKVIDAGTGSGILSIVAAKLGASTVRALDCDETALKVARENFSRNGVDSVVSPSAGDLLTGLDERADIIVANIVADVIIRLLGQLDQHLNPGGKLLCSGIIAQRLPDVAAAAKERGFLTEKVTEEQGWVAAIIARGEG